MIILVIKNKWKWGTFDTCINPEEIANILSISKVESTGYHINYETKEECVVYNTEGESINL